MIIDSIQTKELWHQNLDEIHTRFQVYIHSPFCKSICKFCAYKGCLHNERDYINYYGKYLPYLINTFAEVIESHPVSSFYFGGGTPSLMGPEDMELIFNSLPAFQDVANKYFEIHPAFFTEKKLELLATYNFQTVIFGIQTFNPEEIKRQGRWEQDFDHVLKLVNKAKSLGLKTGIDLISWEGNDKLYSDLIKADELGFDVIFAAVDYNTDSEEVFNHFFNSINRFTAEKKYGYNRRLSIDEHMDYYKNVRLFRSGLNDFTEPGVFNYDSNFGEAPNKHTATLALGSLGNQMMPTTSHIGNKIVYQEVNNKWSPSFNLIKKQEPFIWKMAQ